MNSKNEKINRPYACACINLRKFKNIIKDDINNENNLFEKKLGKLLEAVHVFINKDCIDQMFQFFGTLSKKKITLIAHYGSGFDNYFVLRNKNMILDKPPLKTSRGILSAKVKNPYTNEHISNKWLKEKNIINKELKRRLLPPSTKVYQKIDLRCSFQHMKTSLLKWGKSVKIPRNIRKLEMDHDDINETNYMEKQPIWEPYLRNDILSLAAYVLLYNTVMKNRAPVAQWVVHLTHTWLVLGSKHAWCKNPLVLL